MISVVVMVTMLVLAGGYFIYGRFLARQAPADDNRLTPAREINDGLDYVPARAPLLLGQHFSAIAAAGPIVGPVLAAIWFGWLPAVLWIVLGSIFIGGVHDYLSLAASVRHRAASIGAIVKQHLSPVSYVLFLIFVWLALLYVVTAFADLTAQTFVTKLQGEAYGPAVAGSSVIYLLLALAMGVVLYRFKLPLWLATVIFLPLVFLAVWAGPHLPAGILSALRSMTARQWDAALLAYCFVASIIPMWLLLQPRGYLGGWLLYLTIAVGLLGALGGGFAIRYPALNLDGFASAANGKLLFPILFITIACGACSGFHAIVCSGTTSKQLYKESDARPIGYGGMMLEALVALLAVATVMMLPRGSEELQYEPNIIYARGLASYMQLVKVGFATAFPFALLAFSTFVYDTLDVATRLARYIFQELTGMRGRLGGVLATLASLALPLVFLMSTKEKAYMVAWPIFGTSNQMLASLTLLALAVWLAREGRRVWFVILPMAFMMVMTLTSLVLQVLPFVRALPGGLRGQGLKSDLIVSGVCGLVLLVLSLWLLLESARVLWQRPAKREQMNRKMEKEIQV